MIVYHVHQIERRGGAVQGPCFQAAGVQSEGRGGGGERGKMGMEVGRLGASVRREESRENAMVVQLRPPKTVYPVAPPVPSQTTMTSWSCVNIED